MWAEVDWEIKALELNESTSCGYWDRYESCSESRFSLSLDELKQTRLPWTSNKALVTEQMKYCVCLFDSTHSAAEWRECVAAKGQFTTMPLIIVASETKAYILSTYGHKHCHLKSHKTNEILELNRQFSNDKQQISNNGELFDLIVNNFKQKTSPTFSNFKVLSVL